MSRVLIIFISLLHFINFNTIYSYNSRVYCGPNICKLGEKHIACDNNGKFRKSCVHGRLIPITSGTILKLLENINNIRNHIAGGQEENFDGAGRMATTKWNRELAKLAELSVKRCKSTTDECRNTEEFQEVGQIVSNQDLYKGVYKEKGEELNMKLIGKYINDWYEGRNSCTSLIMESFQRTAGSEQCSAFAQIVQESNTDIGCAMASVGKSPSRSVNLICNFARANEGSRRVYTPGTPAKSCQTGINLKYRYLCSEIEKYDVNREMLTTK